MLYYDDIISVVTLISPTSLSNGKFLGACHTNNGYVYYVWEPIPRLEYSNEKKY